MREGCETVVWETLGRPKHGGVPVGQGQVGVQLGVSVTTRV